MLSWWSGSSFGQVLLPIEKDSCYPVAITQILGLSLARNEHLRLMSPPAFDWAGQRDNRHSERLCRQPNPSLSGL